MANKNEIANLMAVDGWSKSTDAEGFRQLALQFRSPGNASPPNSGRAELYRLIAERKDAGAALEPSNQLLNLIEILR